MRLTLDEFGLLFFNLFLFYGPLWFLVMFLVFSLTQFFSEKKYPIGIFMPPTITYFLSFTVLTTSFIFYLNYDYYFNFMEGEAKIKFIRVLLINLALVIAGIVFVFFKKISKKWLQTVFMSILAIFIFHAYTSVISGEGAELDLTSRWNASVSGKLTPPNFQPRKIRIVIMDGLSLKMIHSLTSEQNLLNFKLLLDNGVYGNVRTFRPNLSLAMLNTVLTGRKPSKFNRHSYYKYKFTDLDHEFDVRPRFIFFRKSPYINTTAFFKRKQDQLLDGIKLHYEYDHRKCVRIIDPPFIDHYSEKALHKNNRFVPLFSDLLKETEMDDEKYNTLKKHFFQDDFIKNLIPQLKDTNVFYSVVRLPGLGVVSKAFYQYHMPGIFGSGSREDFEIKRYGWLIERYYDFYDSIIGNLMSTTGDDELLVVMSLYEYEPLPVWRRILVNLFGQKDSYVYKSLDSLGTILMYEKNAFKKGYSMKTISIYDIFPTLLYYSKFQLSKNLAGEILREIFTNDFLVNNPIDVDTGDQ